MDLQTKVTEAINLSRDYQRRVYVYFDKLGYYYSIAKTSAQLVTVVEAEGEIVRYCVKED